MRPADLLKLLGLGLLVLAMTPCWLVLWLVGGRQ